MGGGWGCQPLLSYVHTLQYAVNHGSVYSSLYVLPRAEVLATDIKELQGEMADYNTLMDKLNTDTEIGAILTDCDMVR